MMRHAEHGSVRGRADDGLTGLILAGGRSRRMGGSPKALLLYEHERLIERQLRVMSRACDELIVVVNEPGQYGDSITGRASIIADRYPGKGPLAGMHAGMSAARCEQVWVVGCDMPFLSEDAALLMLEVLTAGGHEAVIPYIDERPHPLHGLYRRSNGERIAELLLQDQLSVMRFLEQIDCAVCQEDIFRERGIASSFVMNVNTPEEYTRSLTVLDAERGEMRR